ncbi:MAG: cytochrome c maturation protein CcmE [Bacteroidetes bacterium]|nr:cytochrome c maturation protein CcmE [Bacteroidota bacterium]
MNKRYLIGGIIALACVVIGIFSLSSSSIEYANLGKAEQLGKTVQVVGHWVKEEGSKYNSATNEFTFVMRDENNAVIPVVLHGPKPNNFEIAESIVVKGRVENGRFVATDCLTKCPSKYEGNAGDLKRGT